MFWVPTYDFNCKICDYHPWALLMDLNKKNSFKCAVNDDKYECEAMVDQCYDIPKMLYHKYLLIEIISRGGKKVAPDGYLCVILC